MKRLALLVFFFMLCGSIMVNAQETNEGKTQKAQEKVQAVLEKNQQKEMYKAELEVAMLGLRMGAEFSLRNMASIGVEGAQKFGVRYLAGYRFTKRWYVGGIVGVDVTTPFTITRSNVYTTTGSGEVVDGYNYSMTRKDKVYVPVMADVRFYCNVNRVSTYLYTNLGAEFSHSTAGIYLFGVGFDVNTVKAQCLNISLGIGAGSWETTDSEWLGDLAANEEGLRLFNGLAFNLKLGYSF